MKSIFNYLAITLTLIFFTACVPPQQNGGKAAPSGMAGYSQLIFIGGIILVFWLFFIRPQSKRAKNQKKFIEDLQKGDKIVTIAGIHGVINKVNEDGTLHIETSPGSYLKIEKSAISMDWTANINKPAAATPEKK
jgi:preprotein translocase subunit YajC